jgi:hypothetical protein
MDSSRPTLLLLLLPLLVCAGCSQRADPYAVPDRGGHAVSFGSAASAAPAPDQPGPGEEVVTFRAEDRLYRIAEERGVALFSLIERNDLSTLPASGDSLVVPKRSAAGRATIRSGAGTDGTTR